MISDFDVYMFGKGIHYEIYNKLGAHKAEREGVSGTFFAVWAPFAKQVSVVGDFNFWDGTKDGMSFNSNSGIWELFIPEVREGSLYKFQISTWEGKITNKSDPYGFFWETRPNTACIVTDLEGYPWADDEWLKKKAKENPVKEPILIYEVHIGSWRKELNNYRDIARELAEYVLEMGYTHIELMGILEHPLDMSWGYQVTGYYAPTSRFGAPQDFMYLVNHLHEKGIGVIIDWVPAHFPKDETGLSRFDGTSLYEYADPIKGEQYEWGTKVFDFGKNQVSNFLIANALFWIEKYHIDALRMDAVASMLYLDYGKNESGWIPNALGDNRNLEAVEFIKHLNSIMKKRNPRAYIVAEESTAWDGVTRSVEEGGLGFGFKWNMGWMNDFLEYQKSDPIYRKANHGKMNFSLMYAFRENYVLPLSHDEVVHLKGSMIKKMPGYDIDKFKNLKSAYTYMIGHPGKKLLFMGQEFAQWQEWSEERSIDWYLLDQENNKELQSYVSKLFHFYSREKVLYAYEDFGYENFHWINANDSDRSIFSFVRKNPENYQEALLFVCNFTPVDRWDYAVGVPVLGDYIVELNSDYAYMEGEIISACKGECDGFPYVLKFPLKPLSSLIIKFPK